MRSLSVTGRSDDLTVDHGEPLQVLVGFQLLRWTERHTHGHGLDLPLDDVDVTGVQEEDKPAGGTECKWGQGSLSIGPPLAINSGANWQ